MKISKTEIIEMENQLISGIKMKDLSFLNQVLHSDLIFLAPDGVVTTKAMVLGSYQTGDMVVEQLIPTIENINIIGDTAVVVVVNDAKGKMSGRPIQGQFRYMRIWKLFPDGLKVIGGSCFKL